MSRREIKGCKKPDNILKSIIKWDKGGGKTHKVGWKTRRQNEMTELKGRIKWQN